MCLAQLHPDYGETKVVLATPQARVAAHHRRRCPFVGVVSGLDRPVWDMVRYRIFTRIVHVFVRLDRQEEEKRQTRHVINSKKISQSRAQEGWPVSAQLGPASPIVVPLAPK